MTETVAQEQARTKPELENFIAVHLSPEVQQDILAFLDYCKVKKISYPWSSTNSWTLKTKGKSIGTIHIPGNKEIEKGGVLWSVGLNMKDLLQYDDFFFTNELQSIILHNWKPCANCSPCAPGYTGKFLGKEHHNLCQGLHKVFRNPDAKDIESVEKIIDFRMSVTHGTAARPLFDSETHGLTRIDNKKRIIGISDLKENPFPIGPNESVNYLFDGKYASYARFHAGETSHDVLFQLDEPAELVMYSLVTGFRIDPPDGWKLYGAVSKDGVWTLLDAREEFPKPLTNFTERAFKIGTPGTYRCYRITFEGRKIILAQVHLYTQ